MRSLLSTFPKAAALTCVLLGAPSLACADVTFDLNNVMLGNGNTPAGTLSGSFSTNNSFTSLTSADISASPSGTYIGATYTLADSTNNSVLPNFIQLNLNPVTNTSPELRLIFSNALTGAGATLSTSSFEFEITGGERFVTSGSVSQPQTSSTPEPASATLIASAMTMLVALIVRGRKQRV